MILPNVIRIIVGLFLGFLISYYLDHSINTVIKGPNSSEIQENIYSHDNFCYKMIAYPVLSRGKHSS